MRPASLPRLELVAPPICEAGALFVRQRGAVEVVVVAKLAFSFEHDTATPVARPPLVARELHRDRTPLTSLEAAADLVPPLPHPEFLVVGHVHAPGGMLSPQVNVQVQLADQAVFAQKRLVAMGAPRGPGVREPFTRMPLVWERAIRTAENPVGSPDAASLFDPQAPGRAAGLGPIASIWPTRRARLGAASRADVEGSFLDLPDAFDATFFQAAPPDQWLARLRGDEWLLLDGLHRSRARVQTRLPGASILVRSSISAGVSILRPDRLVIDADRAELHLTYRRSLLLASLDVPAVRLELGLSFGGREPVFSATAPVVQAEVPPSVRAAVTSGTVAASSQAGAPRSLPFVRAASAPPPAASPLSPNPQAGATQALPDLPEEGEAPRIVMPAPSAAAVVARPAVAAPPAVVVTELPAPAALGASTQALPDLPDDDEPALPFTPSAASAPPRAPSAPPTRVELPWAEAQAPVVAAAMAVTTLELPDLPEDGSAPVYAPMPDEASSPPVEPPAPHERDAVALRSDARVALLAFPWALEPPKLAWIVVAKLTAALVPREPAMLVDEPATPTGDAFEGDDPEARVLSASDLALWKREADVLVVGHAYPPSPGATASRVKLGLVAREGRVDKEVAVFGPRAWQGALGQTAPLAFDRVSLGYESAFGGSGFAPNPVGKGHKGSREAQELPALESPNERVTSPAETPTPCALGPVHPLAAARASGAGTFDGAFLDARWPWLAADYDPWCQQLAPADQRVKELVGDEPYELVGMSARHPRLAGSLPGVRVRLFAVPADGGPRRELRARLDTLVFEPDHERVHLTYRAQTAVADEEASDLREIIALVEPLARPLSDADVAAAIAALAVPAEEDVPSSPASTATSTEVDPDRAEDEALEASVLASLAEHDADAPPTRGAAPPREASPLDPELAQALLDAGASNDEVSALSDASRGAHEGDADAPGPVDLRALVVDLLARGAPLTHLDLRGADLTGLDLSGRDLSGSDLSKAKLAGAALSDSLLVDTSLRAADLSGASLERARLLRADLHAASIAGARFVEAALDGADLSSVAGAAACFTRARGAGVSFERAALDDADFSDADLPKADFSSTRLPRARFEGARLESAMFYDADLTAARFDRAFARNLRAEALRAEGASFRAALCDDAVFERGRLGGACFEDAELANVNLVSVRAPRARFDRADLGAARLSRGSFEEARFVGANLHEANLDRANLQAADLSLANLHEASLERARIGRAVFTDAIMTHRNRGRQLR